MTKEEAIEEINKAFEPAFANYIITALTEGATVSDKAPEQEPILDKIRTEIESLNPVDYVSIYSYEGHEGARDMKDDVLRILDKY